MDNISSLSEMSDSPRQFSCLPVPEPWEEIKEPGKLENWLVEEGKSFILERLLELENRLEDSWLGPSEKDLLRICEGNLMGVLASL